MCTADGMRVSRRPRPWVAGACAVAAAALALTAQGPAVAATSITTRASVSSTGTQANASSLDAPAVSSDGRYVAFGSDASNLVSGDTNRTQDVFVRDRQTGITSRVSVSGTGAQANGHSSGAAISADGRYVAFSSTASNLVPNDTNYQLGGNDVFLRDRVAGTTRRIDVSSTGAQTNLSSDSSGAAISANGRFVAFNSDATNLVPGDTHASLDVFVRDWQAGTTRRVSLSTAGAQGNGSSEIPSVSADGRYVAFGSNATNLVPGDTNGTSDVFLRDVLAGSTSRLSVSGSGAQGNNAGGEATGSYAPAISADGRYIAFYSFASNLVPNDTNGQTDVFLRDWQVSITRRISYSSSGAQANDYNAFPAISPDGRYVAWHSGATNLVPGDTNGQLDIFVRDWVAGTTRRASVSGTGVQGNSESRFPAIGSGGHYVAFDSAATNLVPGDTNRFSDIFLRIT